LCIISSWARRAWPTISIDAGATVRDDDGLALSSRNRRLSLSARRAAASIPHALRNVQRTYLDGSDSVTKLESVGRASLSSECVLHYLTVVDPLTLERQETATKESVVIIAATIDGVRLIDNVDLSESIPHQR
jgi:pantoate--beta-alanine ligase